MSRFFRAGDATGLVLEGEGMVGEEWDDDGRWRSKELRNGLG